jgi:hypothetical protein
MKQTTAIRLLAFALVALSAALVPQAGAQTPQPLAGQAAAQDKNAQRNSILSLLSIDATPSIEVPIETGMPLFNVGGWMGLRGSIPLPRPGWLELGADLGYTWLPLRAGSSLSVGGLTVGPVARLELSPRFSLFALIEGGGYFGTTNAQLIDTEGLPYADQQGGGLEGLAGAGFDFYLSPTLSVGLRTSVQEYLGLAAGWQASITTTYHLEGLYRRVGIDRPEGIDLFPSLYKSYSSAPIAKATLANHERFPIDAASVSLFIKGLMDSPTSVTVRGRLGPGETQVVSLPAVLSDRVLALASDGFYPVEIRCAYTLNGKRHETTASYRTLIHARNAITWNDDRKVASFMDAQAPDLLAFVKPLAVMVRQGDPKAIDLNFRMGMGLFEALGAMGMGYVLVPNAPTYAESSKDPTIIDLVQYPLQTLAWKGGDCSDLTTLYCALLESVGIETGFITVPGHIFAAFPLVMSPAEAKRTLSSTDDLIVRGDHIWVPVEVTAVNQGFLAAWSLGAREWRDSDAKGEAKFYEVRECWKVWPTAGSPSDSLDVKAAPMPASLDRYHGAMLAFVDREIGPKELALNAQIAQSNNSAKSWESLGVLYARYGLLDKAEAAFMSALSAGDSMAALVNLATIYRIRNDLSKAGDMLDRAEKLDPRNSLMLLGQALVNNLQGKVALAQAYYGRLASSSPDLAKNYAWLGKQDTLSASRATDIADSTENIVWSEGE